MSGVHCRAHAALAGPAHLQASNMIDAQTTVGQPCCYSGGNAGAGAAGDGIRHGWVGRRALLCLQPACRSQHDVQINRVGR